MNTLEEAIDDYFHSIVRTHPWDKKRFEEALEPMQAWFDDEFSEPAPLAALTGAHIARYMAMLEGDDQSEAECAVTDLCTWLATWGWLDANPLEQVYA